MNILQKYKKILDEIILNFYQNKKKYLTHIITELTIDNSLKEITLYIIAPELKYEYRVLNIELVNDNKLKLIFFTLKTLQSEHYEVDISNGESNYIAKLNEIFSNKLFDYSLDYLVGQIELKNEHKGSIIDKIIIGQARVAILNSGEKINVGFIRVDNNDVYFYTGKGLREMWKPNMSDKEKTEAERLKLKTENELIQEGYIDRKGIDEFTEII